MKSHAAGGRLGGGNQRDSILVEITLFIRPLVFRTVALHWGRYREAEQFHTEWTIHDTIVYIFVSEHCAEVGF